MRWSYRHIVSNEIEDDLWHIQNVELVIAMFAEVPSPSPKRSSLWNLRRKMDDDQLDISRHESSSIRSWIKERLGYLLTVARRVTKWETIASPSS